MTTQFAAGRSQLLSPAVYNIGSGSIMGGNSTYYFWLQGRNRCGYNFPSSPFSLTVPDSCSLGIVIPGVSYYSSEDWHEFLLYTNTTNNFGTSRLVGTYKALENNQVTKRTLGSNTPLSSDPKQITLTQNYHLNFSSTVATPNDLPNIPLHGMRRFVTSLSRTYRYDENSTLTANGDTILSATTGRWIFNESNNVIENPTNLATNINGCNQNINSVFGNPDLLSATYDVSGNVGIPIKYYLKSASNITIPKGTIISLSVRIDNQDVTNDFSELLDVIVYGKVRFSDYSLITTNFLSAGSVVPYNHFSKNILLEDDILPNEALLISVAPAFSATDVDTNITPSVGLSIYPYFSENISTYSDINLTVGNIIFDESDRRLVVPYGLGTLRVLNGSGCVNLYTWRNKPTTDLTGYTSNSTNQSVVITRTGDVIIGTPSSLQLRRALFSTAVGYSTPCIFSTPTSISSGETVNYTINIDQDIDGYNPISTTYSDLFLRGLPHRAKLNTNKILLIIKVDSVYKGFTITFDPTLSTISGTISNWSSGTTITTGDIAGFNKNLFKPLNASHTVGGSGGTIPTGNVSIAYSFFYDGTSVSDISHSTVDGCITTQTISDADLGARYLFWGEAVNDIVALRNIEKEGDSFVEARYVASKRHPYHYDPTCELNDDGDRVIKPNDISASGRWLADYSNAWFTGTTVPSNILGDYGDWYLRSDTADLYRKDDTNTWILNSNIRGLSGTVWRSGSGVPSNSLGINGDYYLNILNSGIYTKASGVYTLQGSLSTQISTVNDLAALTAIDVTTITDGVLRVVKDTVIYQYNATATIGGVAPDTGAGRWFILSQSSGSLSEIKTSNFTATSFGDYIINSSTNITPTLPSAPVDGTPISFLTVNTGRVNVPFGTIVNGLYRVDAYLIKDKVVKLIYANSTLGWVCPTTDVFNGILQGLMSFWEFNTSLYPLDDYIGGRDFSDTGSASITFTTGLIAGTSAANFNNATANYQLSQSSTDLSPTTIPFTDTLGFTFLVNLSSGTQPIISQKWSSDSTKYTYAIRAIDSTHIQFSIETGGTGAGLFTATVAVTNAYSTNLLIIATMPVAFTVKSPRVMSLQVGDSTGLSSIVYTAITGDFQTSDALIIGQSESGSQIVGVVDQIRAYNWELDSNQRTLLWAGGAFV